LSKEQLPEEIFKFFNTTSLRTIEYTLRFFHGNSFAVVERWSYVESLQSQLSQQWKKVTNSNRFIHLQLQPIPTLIYEDIFPINMSQFRRYHKGSFWIREHSINDPSCLNFLFHENWNFFNISIERKHKKKRKSEEDEISSVKV